MQDNKKKIMVAMSGGVDSSVSVIILKNLGYEISGATMKLFSNKDIDINKNMDLDKDIDHKAKTCCALNDVFDAKNIAARFNFSHYVFNFSQDFFECVIKKFANEYINARTPNPCLDCNKYIKFKKFLSRAMFLGYDYIATGHYARIEYNKKLNRYLLKRAKDKSKDQTYFLYTMTQYELSKTIFPLGNLLKSEVRNIAQENNLINAKKPDSQDICFIKNNSYSDFLYNKFNIKAEPGNFIDKSKKIIGKHKGIINYTIGQRKKLGMSFNKHMYVIKKNKFDNSIMLGDEKDLYKNKLIAGEINLILIDKLKTKLKIKAKARYSQNEVDAYISPYEKDENKILVEFLEPQRAISPGQAIVFYSGENVFGGGVILE